MVHDPKAKNGWETSRSLFFGRLWGGGFPLKSNQEFRGGDAFTASLAVDPTFSEWRSTLVGQAREKGMDAKYAKKDATFYYDDAGPEPGNGGFGRPDRAVVQERRQPGVPLQRRPGRGGRREEPVRDQRPGRPVRHRREAHPREVNARG
ncbi:hypothetical protein ACH47Z_08435 [Streptomyces sp. NPDC020192]|uniref:hypothetical protein n=1 Tax=Streptomyces sp. NPDC020192 TaxID=3365066 RepID=UPI0037B22E69